MHFRTAASIWCLLLAALSWTGAPVGAQRSGIFQGKPEDAGIEYSSSPLDNPIDRLNKRMQSGAVKLTFEGRAGYLRSLVDALQIPVSSQLLVFSNSSFQGVHISPK